MRLLSSLFLFLAASSQAATYTVCTAGAPICSYGLTQLQTAVDTATGGDIIEIEAGSTATVSGGLRLKNKSLTDWPGILIRSSKAYALPFGARVTPSADAANMATIQGSTGYYYTIGGCDKGAGYYRFHGIRFIPPAPATFSGDILELNSRSSYHSNVNDTEEADLVHHLVFDQCIFDANGSNAKRGIRANTGWMEVRNSYFTNFHAQSYEEILNTIEAQAIGGWNAKGPFYFRNNYFSSAGITTLFGGATPNIGGLKPDGVWYIGNHYYRSWKYRTRYKTTDPTGACLYDSEGGEWWKNTYGGSWYVHAAPPTQTYWQCVAGTWTSVADPTNFSKHYTQKNIFELKNAQRVWVEGNYLENAWQPADYNQQGTAILINQVDNDNTSTFEPASTIAHVNFSNNHIRRTAWGVQVGAQGTTYYQWYRNVTFENNVFEEIGDPRWTIQAAERNGSKFNANGFVLPSRGDRFRYLHNTLQVSYTTPLTGWQPALWMFGYVPTGTATTEAAVVGNIMSWGHAGFHSEVSGGHDYPAVPYALRETRSISRNVVVNEFGLTIHGVNYNTYNLKQVPVHNPNGPFGCNSCGTPQLWSEVGMVDYAGRNYRLDAASAYKYFAHGKDPGADIDVVEWSTAGATAGTANPYLDFQVKNVTVSTSTLTLVYTSYNTEQCTLSVSAKWDMSSPSSQADVAGDRERTVSVGSLSASTRYWWKLSCGTGAYYRTGVAITQPSL